MKHADLPRVLRRAVGLMRFAREAVGAAEASLFLLDREGKILTGVVSEWDWTRTSFGANVAEWPTVAECVADGKVRLISKEDATAAERGWFEPRGISKAACVPLWHRERAFGVIFIDFAADAEPLEPDELQLLADVGLRCGRALEREEKSIANLAAEKIVIGTTPPPPAESQRSLRGLLDDAMRDVVTAEKLLEDAIRALSNGDREKVFIGTTLEAAFVRLREAREELERL